jgi:hypothetical protein
VGSVVNKVAISQDSYSPRTSVFPRTTIPSSSIRSWYNNPICGPYALLYKLGLLISVGKLLNIALIKPDSRTLTKYTSPSPRTSDIIQANFHCFDGLVFWLETITFRLSTKFEKYLSNHQQTLGTPLATIS